MSPLSPETCISLLHVAIGGLFALLGLPLYLSWIPPNRFYGFRTERTIANPAVWYRVNRVSGGWLIMTGTLAVAVTSLNERMGFGLHGAAVINCSVVVVGMLLMVAHSLRTLWRMK
jgi:uncharacterized membrane protein